MSGMRPTREGSTRGTRRRGARRAVRPPVDATSRTFVAGAGAAAGAARVRPVRVHAEHDREADRAVRPDHPGGDVERAGGLRAGWCRSASRRSSGIGAYGTIRVRRRTASTRSSRRSLAALVAGALSMPVSLLVLRLRGGQFAIGMWVVAEVFRAAGRSNDQSVGGGTGRSLTGSTSTTRPRAQAYTYWLALGVHGAASSSSASCCCAAALGPSLQAIRDDEDGRGVARRARDRRQAAAVRAGRRSAAAAARCGDDPEHAARPAGLDLRRAVDRLHDLHGAARRPRHVRGADPRRARPVLRRSSSSADEGSWYLVGLGAVAIVVTLLLPARPVGRARRPLRAAADAGRLSRPRPGRDARTGGRGGAT